MLCSSWHNTLGHTCCQELLSASYCSSINATIEVLVAAACETAACCHSCAWRLTTTAGCGPSQVGYFHGFIDGVDHVFIDHNCYHNLGSDIYSGDRQQILFRCALLSKAALEAVWHVPCGGVPYGDDNLVFIANDWHTALLPIYLQVRDGAGPQLAGTSSGARTPLFPCCSYLTHNCDGSIAGFNPHHQGLSLPCFGSTYPTYLSSCACLLSA